MCLAGLALLVGVIHMKHVLIETKEGNSFRISYLNLQRIVHSYVGLTNSFETTQNNSEHRTIQEYSVLYQALQHHTPYSPILYLHHVEPLFHHEVST